MLERFAGVTTALITPFTADCSAVDEVAFAALASRQVEEGVDALVVGSLTGEGPTLSVRERERLIAITVEVAAGRIPVIAATGSNGTDASIAATRRALDLGANAAHLIVPFYNKPSQEGLVRHVEAVASAVDLPLILEDAPRHCGIGLAMQTLVRLGAIPSLIGLADGSGDVTRPAIIREIVDRPFLHLTTRDDLVTPFVAAGGHGSVSSLANVAPDVCIALHRAHREDIDRQRVLAVTLTALNAAIEENGPASVVKHALSLIRPVVSAGVRLPMVPLGHLSAEAVAAAVALLGDGRQSRCVKGVVPWPSSSEDPAIPSISPAQTVQPRV